MFNRVKKIFTNQFTKGTYQDSLPSDQPLGTYREAWSAVKQVDGLKGFGIGNENSNELFINIENEIRGLIFAEERDQYIVLSVNSDNIGELGILDLTSKEYRKLRAGEDIEVDCENWVDMELKVVSPCNELHLYYSSNHVYKTINIDDPCCLFEVKELLKTDCVPSFDFRVHENGGRLPNGKYWFFCRLRDSDGNETNWFSISRGISISDDDHVPAEISSKAINVILKNLNRDYTLIDLGVVSTIGGLTSTEHFDTISFGDGNIDYLYTGKTGKEITLDVAAVRARNPKYLRGKNLMQYDGRLVLYNILSEHNLDYQRQANEIETYYDVWAVPGRFAHNFSGLRPNENYWFNIRWNYIDGTFSSDFVIPGRPATDEEIEKINDPCRDCELPRWRLEDTSIRTDLFLEDVHVSNKDYDDVIFNGDNQRDDNYVDDDLSKDEKDTIDPDEIEDLNEDDLKREVDKGKKDFKLYMDCLCGKLEAFDVTLCTGIDPFCPPPNINDECDVCDIFTLEARIIVENLKCLCESLTTDDSPGGSGIIDPNDLQAIYDAQEAAKTNNYVYQLLAGGGSCSGGNCGSGGGCGSGGCGGCGGGGCGSGGVSCGGGGCGGNCSGNCSCKTVVSNLSLPTAPISSTGDIVTRSLDYYLNRASATVAAINNEKNKYSICDDGGCGSGAIGCQLVQTRNKCNVEGATYCGDNVCYECHGGYWYVTTNIKTYEFRESYQRVPSLQNAPQPLSTFGTNKSKLSDDFSFEYIKDSDGCEIVGVHPRKYSTGRFGFWETEEIYPFTTGCDCDYLYGDLAGRKVRLHRAPSISKEPHFVSFAGGVPNMYDQGNMEDKDSFVFFISPRFENIKIPKNLPKPLCPSNPFSITYVERTSFNKSVIGTGLAISCFKGEIQGEPFVFAKHGVNSWERYAREIEPSGPSTFRGGTAVSTSKPYDLTPANVAPYVIHSLDFHMLRPPLDATDCLFELELSGKGFRHGLGAEGERPERNNQDKLNQKGTRQSLTLNHYNRVSGATTGYVKKCVNAMTQAPADTIVSKSDEFAYSLCNSWRESSVYAELNGPLVSFVEGDKQGMGTKYGGDDNNGDNASDRSFTGDTLTHQMPIHDVRGHLVTFTKYIPNQYGSPIGQTCIPFGLEGGPKNLATGNIEGCMGDSYCGPVSFRRTSYISDKTNRKISRRVVDAGFDVSHGEVKRLVGNLFSFIFRSLGIRNGGYIPKSRDTRDFINIFGGLRHHADTIRTGDTAGVHFGELTDGDFPNPATSKVPSDGSDRNAGDNYFYNIVKSNVWTWMNSDTIPAYRQTGNPEAMQIYWPRLKGKKLDSSMPDGYNWMDTYLNRWYNLWVENSRWKLLAQAVFLLLFTYGLGIWLIATGFSATVNGFQAIGGGTYSLQTIGGVIGAIFGIILIVFGYLWIQHWLISDQDNLLAESFVLMKNLRPDVKNPREPAERGNYPTYSFKDSRLTQFEDNYWRYNTDLSRPNIFEYGYCMSDPYNTCMCPDEYTNKVVYSNKQNISSQIDAWKNFKLNNMIDIPTNTGKISKIFNLGNNVFVHTTDMLMDLRTGSRSLSLDRGQLLLGSGDLFGESVPIFGGVVEGYAGLLDPNSAYVTNWGYIFPDREARKVYMFTGQMPQPISDNGITWFLQQNMQFKLLEKFPEFKNVDQKSPHGIGYSIGVDHKYNRLLFTKKDYDILEGKKVTFKGGKFYDGTKPISLGDPRYFCDASFTRSYDPGEQSWISRHFYTPLIYTWDRFNMYSFGKKGLYLHNIPGSYQVFYDERHPFIVDVVVRDDDFGYTFDYENTIVDLEAFNHAVGSGKYSTKFFDHMIAFNTYQSTGLMEIAKVTGSHQPKDSGDRLDVFNEHRMHTFNKLYDHVIDPYAPIFLDDCTNTYSELNSTNIGKAVSNKIFSDNHLIYRFIFNSSDDTQLFLKRVFTKANVNTISI